MIENKTILITGANSGIGKIAAFELAKMGAHIVMLCRNKEKAEPVKQEIMKLTSNDKVELVIIDLADLNSVKTAATEINNKYEKIDVLLNNAGGYFQERKLSTDGFEYTFAMNHLGHFLLTNLLLDKIKTNGEARIINVSSAAHNMGKINFDDLMSKKEYSGMKVYGTAKLANLFFTYELAKKLSDTNITVNALHPGVVNTNFGANAKGVMKIIITLMKPFMRSANKGAETSIYLAASPSVEGISGKYFIGKKEKPSSKESYDKEISKHLWEESVKLTGL